MIQIGFTKLSIADIFYNLISAINANDYVKVNGQQYEIFGDIWYVK